jgi:hypothetical protein
MKKFAQILLAGSLATAMWAQATPAPTAHDAGTATASKVKKIKKHKGKRAKHEAPATGTTQAR